MVLEYQNPSPPLIVSRVAPWADAGDANLRFKSETRIGVVLGIKCHSGASALTFTLKVKIPLYPKTIRWCPAIASDRTAPLADCVITVGDNSGIAA